MKKMAVVLASLMIAACASTPKSDSSQAAQANEKGTSTANTASESASVSKAETESRDLTAEIQELQKQSVYFGFDMSDIKPEYRDVVQREAEFIKGHKNDVVTVEGNCDGRGSTDYNLALGERRANAAKKSLELSGVPAAQIKTTSLGEGKPRLSCHEEKCWKENRRDDFVHKLN